MSSQSSQKASIILLGVVALAVLAGGFFWLTVGPQILGLILLILGILALVWVWRAWTRVSKA
jgi:protein-S-isoprenylcysteine O-methyltransferase Ste14